MNKPNVCPDSWSSTTHNSQQNSSRRKRDAKCKHSRL